MDTYPPLDSLVMQKNSAAYSTPVQICLSLFMKDTDRRLDLKWRRWVFGRCEGVGISIGSQGFRCCSLLDARDPSYQILSCPLGPRLGYFCVYDVDQ